MAEEISLVAIVIYLETHPLIAVLLVALVVIFLGSLLRKLIKMAVVLGLVLLAFFYYTHREASEDWQVRAELVKKHATELGKQALGRGAELIEQGKKELEKQIGEAR